MYCKKCGKQLTDGSLFCSNCGEKIASNPNQQSKIIVDKNVNYAYEYVNSQPVIGISQDQKVKIVFSKTIDRYFGKIGIYIDDQKIAKINFKQKTDTFVTVGQHKLSLKDYRSVTNHYSLNITSDIKTIYLDLYLDLCGFPCIKTVRIERESGEQQAPDNNVLINTNSQTNSSSQQTVTKGIDNNVVKQIKSNFWSGLCFITAILGITVAHIPLAIIAIVFGICAFCRGFSDYTESGFAFFGIIIGIGIIIYSLLVTSNIIII